MDNWKDLILEEMERHEESWGDIQYSTLTDEEAEGKFDSGYGLSEGVCFTLWTENRVYFPAVYDGSEWAESVPRHPCNEKTPHVGGQ